MQEGGAGEPWHQRCIFDGIPSPVSSPAKDGVGPMRAQKNSAGEKSPGNHGPAAGGVGTHFPREISCTCPPAAGGRDRTPPPPQPYPTRRSPPFPPLPPLSYTLP